MTLPETRVPVKVWDLPVRIVHWALVLLFAFQVVSAQVGGNWMNGHAVSGYAILVLMIFRVLWGFAGSRHARFASFLVTPLAVLRFLPQLLSRRPLPFVGHNPLGGWMVLALVGDLLAQGSTGLFANDGAGFEGPLAYLVSYDVSGTISQFHRWNAKLLGVLIGLHVAAVVFHFVVRRENLVTPMLSGTKQVAANDAMPAADVSPWRAAGLLAIALVFVYVVVRLG